MNFYAVQKQKPDRSFLKVRNETKTSITFLCENDSLKCGELFELFFSDGDIICELDRENKFKFLSIAGYIEISKIEKSKIKLPLCIFGDIYMDLPEEDYFGGIYIEDYYDFSNKILFDETTGWLQIGETGEVDESFSFLEDVIISLKNRKIVSIFVKLQTPSKQLKVRL